MGHSPERNQALATSSRPPASLLGLRVFLTLEADSDRLLEALFFSAVGEAELRYGAAILPTGRRRETLGSDIERMLHDAFKNRVLPFDREAARAYADIAATRRSAGRPVAPADCQIAAIARSRDMAVATRNVRDFEDIDIDVVDPWATA